MREGGGGERVKEDRQRKISKEGGSRREKVERGGRDSGRAKREREVGRVRMRERESEKER